MRLKGQHQATSGEGPACSGQGRGHFDRVVAVVVDHGDLSALGQRPVAIGLEAAGHAFEFGQRLQQRGIRHIELHRHANRRQGVAHIVFTWQVEHHIQVGQDHAVAPGHGEMHA